MLIIELIEKGKAVLKAHPEIVVLIRTIGCVYMTGIMFWTTHLF